LIPGEDLDGIANRREALGLIHRLEPVKRGLVKGHRGFRAGMLRAFYPAREGETHCVYVPFVHVAHVALTRISLRVQTAAAFKLLIVAH
jgi:hypothetical protein